MNKVKSLSFAILILLNISTFAQNIPLGGWRVHLPFNKAKIVADAGNKIYCAAEDGMFTYNKGDNSIESFSKINGLSDIGLTVMKYNSSKNMLVIGYENANLDIISGQEIINIADIKRKNIVGNKSVNAVSFVNQYAFLACGFGIVVIDLDRMEIKDTYYIGSNGSSINVSGIVINGADLFAATDSGVYQVNINDPNINFYGTWTKILDADPAAQFNHIAYFNNKLYVCKHPSNRNDYLVSYENGIWTNAPIPVFYDIKSLQTSNNKLVVTSTSVVKVYDEQLQEIKNIDAAIYPGYMFDAFCDNAGIVWIADNNKGLVKVSSSAEYIVPDGPRSKYSAGMQIINDQLWVGHSVTGRKWSNLYSGDGFSTYAGNRWYTYDKTNLFSSIVSMDTLYDFMSLVIDPNNSEHVYFGSRGTGLLELENRTIKNYYNESNSTLKTAIGNSASCQIGGLSFDQNGNLWVANSTVPSPLSELKTDRTWQAFSFQGALTSNAFIGEFMIDSYGQKWIDNNENGLVVFDETGTLGSVKYKFLNTEVGKGHLPSADVRALVEDKEGQVWVGTALGIAVFYSPASILSDNTNSDAQQVLLLQDGTYQYLLATEVVTSIAIDGANRKWIGTENAGVFLMNQDGTKQLLHYTAENSPLLSNNILSMAINQKTGEVFIGTDRGIISYKSDAIEGGETCIDTYVYPNPVYHEYEGPIAIKGVMNDGNIKITDVSGTLIFETTALGGQAIWNGKNFKGEKAHTGVYLVFCSDSDGKNTCMTKLLLIN